MAREAEPSCYRRLAPEEPAGCGESRETGHLSGDSYPYCSHHRQHALNSCTAELYSRPQHYLTVQDLLQNYYKIITKFILQYDTILYYTVL